MGGGPPSFFDRFSGGRGRHGGHRGGGLHSREEQQRDGGFMGGMGDGGGYQMGPSSSLFGSGRGVGVGPPFSNNNRGGGGSGDSFNGPPPFMQQQQQNDYN